MKKTTLTPEQMAELAVTRTAKPRKSKKTVTDIDGVDAPFNAAIDAAIAEDKAAVEPKKADADALMEQLKTMLQGQATKTLKQALKQETSMPAGIALAYREELERRDNLLESSGVADIARKARKASDIPVAKKDLPASSKEFPLCKCGCGDRTRGGTFRMGHDARYHAMLRKAGQHVILLKDLKGKTKQEKMTALGTILVKGQEIAVGSGKTETKADKRNAGLKRAALAAKVAEAKAGGAVVEETK